MGVRLGALGSGLVAPRSEAVRVPQDLSGLQRIAVSLDEVLSSCENCMVPLEEAQSRAVQKALQISKRLEQHAGGAASMREATGDALWIALEKCEGALDSLDAQFALVVEQTANVQSRISRVGWRLRLLTGPRLAPRAGSGTLDAISATDVVLCQQSVAMESRPRAEDGSPEDCNLNEARLNGQVLTLALEATQACEAAVEAAEALVADGQHREKLKSELADAQRRVEGLEKVAGEGLQQEALVSKMEERRRAAPHDVARLHVESRADRAETRAARESARAQACGRVEAEAHAQAASAKVQERTELLDPTVDVAKSLGSLNTGNTRITTDTQRRRLRLCLCSESARG